MLLWCVSYYVWTSLHLEGLLPRQRAALFTTWLVVKSKYASVAAYQRLLHLLQGYDGLDSLIQKFSVGNAGKPHCPLHFLWSWSDWRMWWHWVDSCEVQVPLRQWQHRQCRGMHSSRQRLSVTHSSRTQITNICALFPGQRPCQHLYLGHISFQNI